MPLVDEIEDETSLRAWLETQPREVAVDIAHRAAMRVLPIYWDWELRSRIEFYDALPVLRANLISGIFRSLGKHVIDRARLVSMDALYLPGDAHQATVAGRAAQLAVQAASARHAASHATDAIAQAADAASDVFADTALWTAVRFDAYDCDMGRSPLKAKLWAKSDDPFNWS